MINVVTKLQATATVLVLFSLYWLTASGAFHSIDEEAVFAVSRTIVLEGEANQNALYRAVPYIDQAKIGIDGAFYSKYGIGHALAVAPALFLARWVPGATLGSSAMLVNALATALTGGLLVLTATRSGYRLRTGIAAGLLYGGATFAWVYAKTMFSEPLVGLLWLLAVYYLLVDITPRRAFLSGVALAVALSIRPASILVTPLFAFLLLAPLRPMVSRFIAWGLPIAVVGVGLLGFNLVRFGNPFDFGYSESFNGNLLVGVQGFLFSLDRSVFIFAPPLLALFGTVPLFLRRHRRVGGAILLVSLSSLLLYSAWAVFWGGPVWGPRYLLPLLPLLFVLLLPGLERAWEGQRVWQWLFVVVGVAGVAIQIPGVVWNSLPMTQELGQRYALWLLAPRAAGLDLAWYEMPQGALLSLLLLFLAGVALARPRPLFVAVAGTATLVGSVVLLSWWGQTSFGYQWHPIDAEIATVVAERVAPGDALLLNPAPFQEPIPRLVGWMNQPYPPATLYGVVRDPADTTTQPATVDYVLSRHKRIWLLTDGVGQGDINSPTEQWLATRAFPVETTWYGDTTRLTLLEREGIPLSGGGGVAFSDGIRLAHWNAFAGDGTVQVRLEWLPTAEVPRDLHTFAQLLNAEGQLLVGWDSVPQFGFAPASTWQPHIVVQESLGLVLPDGHPIEDMQLIVGLYDSVTGERLRVSTGDDYLRLPLRGGATPAGEGQGE